MKNISSIDSTLEINRLSELSDYFEVEVDEVIKDINKFSQKRRFKEVKFGSYSNQSDSVTLTGPRPILARFIDALEVHLLAGPQSMEEDDGLDYTISHKPVP